MLNKKLNKSTDLNRLFKEKPELEKALAKKLEKNFNIDEFLIYFINNAESVVKVLTEEILNESGFPKEAKWKDVLWELKGQNRVDFREWIKLGASKHFITGEDILDKLNDFIKSDRDYKMFAKEWKTLLNIRVVLLETPQEWYQRRGQAEELAKLLEKNYDATYIGERLKDAELIDNQYNPVKGAFAIASREAGLSEKATIENTRYKVIPSIAIPYRDFAQFVTAIFNNDKDGITHLLSLNSKELNEIYLMTETLTFTQVKITILDTIAEWEDRNQMLSNPKNAIAVLAKKVSENFDAMLIGEMLSTSKMLEQPQNTIELKVQEKLAEEQFPKGATVRNVDFDALAELLMPTEHVAQNIIAHLNNDLEAVNNFSYLPKERFNLLWQFPIFVNMLDFKIKLKQTAEEWQEQNRDRLAEQEDEKENYDY